MLLPRTALPMRSVHDHIVRTEYTRREDQNKARIGQKHSVSFNIVIIKGINVIDTYGLGCYSAMCLFFYTLFPSGMSITIGSS